MKKNFVFILLLVFCFLTVSCANNFNANRESDSVSTHENTENDKQTSQNTAAQLNASDEEGGADILPRKYRNNYYQIPSFFSEIVDGDAFLAWEKEYYLNNYPDNTNVMVMVDFINEFNISKEDFERANLEYAKFINEVYSHICLDPQDYADQEMQEIYNADIIYTFDNDIINEYYLGIDYPFLNEYQYEEAVADGTYQTRTTEFVTLEQMEAEIIAKYGEAEIITEPTEAITETIAAIPEESKTTE